MSNVLTGEAKKNLDRRMRARFVFIGASIVSLAALVAALALAPAFVSVQIAQASLHAPSLEETRAAQDDQEKVARAQSLVTALGPLTHASSSVSDALALALELQPRSISITALTYQAATHQIVLSGTSQSREAVNEFRDALREAGAFTDVSVPVAALVGAQEGRFTITLTGDF
ncbi:MAG TPA: PilN domain-containing protein [Candidatus Paceibacterota bacterium]|nr:PilN domain-containing protein [Candidatus Paceibacterota bacterium]